LLAMLVVALPDSFPERWVSLAVFIGGLGWPFILVGGVYVFKYDALRATIAKRAKNLAYRKICCIGQEGPCSRRCMTECENHWRSLFDMEEKEGE